MPCPHPWSLLSPTYLTPRGGAQGCFRLNLQSHHMAASTALVMLGTSPTSFHGVTFGPIYSRPLGTMNFRQSPLVRFVRHHFFHFCIVKLCCIAVSRKPDIVGSLAQRECLALVAWSGRKQGPGPSPHPVTDIMCNTLFSDPVTRGVTPLTLIMIGPACSAHPELSAQGV